MKIKRQTHRYVCLFFALYKIGKRLFHKSAEKAPQFLSRIDVLLAP